MKLLRGFLLLFMVALAPLNVSAEALAPDQLVRQLSDQVLEIIRSNEKLRNGDPSEVVRLVEEVVLPHFNFRRMTMLAVGRDWRDATPEQQQRLMDGFYHMLVRTYSNALTQYKDQTIDFRPLRMSPDDTTVRVQTSIRQPGAQPVGVDYVMEKEADGWKVFDVVVAGASLVTNYRGTFTQEIRVGGIDGLIKSLESHEMRIETPAGQS